LPASGRPAGTVRPDVNGNAPSLAERHGLEAIGRHHTGARFTPSLNFPGYSVRDLPVRGRLAYPLRHSWEVPMDAKSRLDRRERLDELTARTRYEARLFLNKSTAEDAYDNLADIFYLGHTECAELFEHHRVLPRWERALLRRYCKRIYGAAVLRSVRDMPRAAGLTAEVGARFSYLPDHDDPQLDTTFDEAPALVHAFRSDIAALAPASGDSGARYDMQGRGLLTVFRLAIGKAGEAWPDRFEVASTSARNVLTCSEKFAKRRMWHVLWPVYRVRGLRLWKL
jgi:hypothetical protein